MEQDESKSPQLVLNTAESAILLGLKAFGRSKTFAEILDEAHVPHGDALRYQIATVLERHGLIQNISYQLPVRIRAELTEQGEAWIEAARTNYPQWFTFPTSAGWLRP